MEGQLPTVITLMADFGADPLWDMTPRNSGMLGLASVPLSDDLRHDLTVWAREYDQKELADEPWVDKSTWIARGSHLARRLEEELPSGTRVVHGEDR